jgi:hypothetical protein
MRGKDTGVPVGSTSQSEISICAIGLIRQTLELGRRTGLLALLAVVAARSLSPTSVMSRPHDAGGHGGSHLAVRLAAVRMAGALAAAVIGGAPRASYGSVSYLRLRVSDAIENVKTYDASTSTRRSDRFEY